MSENMEIEWPEYTFNPWVGNWRQPIRWNAKAKRLGVRHRVLCSSLADMFDNAVPHEWRVGLFNLIISTPQLDWLLLTKRIGNAGEIIESTLRYNVEPSPPDHSLGWPWPNVWIGASICNQEEADRDIPKLLAVPAERRFLNIEPPLELVDIQAVINGMPGRVDGCGVELHWILIGGGYSYRARPMYRCNSSSWAEQQPIENSPFI